MGQPVHDLNTIPFPARHLLKTTQGGNIFAYGKHYATGDSTVILTSRGCPFKCSFCGSPYFTNLCGGVRFRKAKNICDEIKSVVDEFNIKQFRLSDDMFIASRQRTINICHLIGELGISWRISTRVKPFDYEIAKTMADAGCKEVSFGIESFDNNVLKALKKGTTATENAKAIKICKDAGMTSRVLFMIRTPGQSKHTVPINIKWLEQTPYDIIACTSFVPMPGSDIWTNPDDYNIEILNRNLDNYNFYFYGSGGENKLQNIIRIKGRSLEELNEETTKFKNYIKSTGKLNTG